MATEPLKHTPLPWELTTRSGSWDYVIYCKANPNNEICQMFHDGTNDNDEGEANAKLIVTAVNSHHSLTAENERLKAALRKHCIKQRERMAGGGLFVHVGGLCTECESEWGAGEPETHGQYCALSAQTPPKAGGDDVR